jgi:diguanylate cyclase (GGDEF)-like protein
LLEGRLRGHDFLGRYGGEEFCVVAPDTDAEGAMTLAEHLREAIASAPFSGLRGKFTVSISIGISICPAGGSGELRDMLEKADAALYNAKQTGRNRVVSYGAGISRGRI